MSSLWSIVISGTPYTFTSQGVYLRAWQGAGLPPIQNLISAYGLRPGARYERTQISARTIVLEGRTIGTSLSNLHSVRATLLRRMLPGALVTLRYTGASSTVEIDGYYEGGLELGDMHGFSDRLVLRFVCPDPFFRATSNTTGSLATSGTVAGVNNVSARIGGIWSNMGGGIGSSGTDIHALRRNPVTGIMYAATSGGVYAWNGSTWAIVGGAANSHVYALAFNAAGTILYAGGAYTTINSVSANRVAQWNGTTWSALGSGFASGNVLALETDLTGALWAGGTIPSYLLSWDGATWTAQGSFNGTVQVIRRAPNGDLYVGGGFTASGAKTINYLAWLDTSLTVWYAVDNALDGSVLDVQILSDTGTRLVVCGTFGTGTNADFLNGVGIWNGTSWNTMQGGMNGVVNRLAVDPDTGWIYAAGEVFTTAGGAVLPDTLAVWNGAAWMALDVNTPGAYVQRVAMLGSGPGDIVIADTNSGSLGVAGRTTITVTGSAESAPTITLSGTGRIYSIVNATTGATLAFSLVIASGETLTLDCDTKTFTSSTGENKLSTLRGGSDMAAFVLIPGANVLAVFAEATVTATYAYRPRYLSVDG